MDLKRIAIGTIVGAVTLHIVGYLMFDLATTDFYDANNAAAANFARGVVLQWSIALGNLAFGVLLALCIDSRNATIGSGVVIGAVVGFLTWFGVDFTLFGYESRWNLMLTIVDPLLAAIQFAIAGAVVAAVLARVPRSVGIQPAR